MPATATAVEGTAGLSLRMRSAPVEVEGSTEADDVESPAEPGSESGSETGSESGSETDPVDAEGDAPTEPEGDAPAEPHDADVPGERTYEGPTAVRDEPGRDASWVDPNPRPTPEPAPAEPAAAEAVTRQPPPPSSVHDVPEQINVAVGLAPEAPGSRDERDLLDALEAGAMASTDPTVQVRRLRAGAGSPRRLCRERRDDLVVMIGYVADREEPVVLAHDCRLDQGLSVRGAEAASEPELMRALWDEHLELARSGVRERRMVAPLSPRARAGIIGGVAVVVVGVAIGALVANALREESVVITVRP